MSIISNRSKRKEWTQSYLGEISCHHQSDHMNVPLVLKQSVYHITSHFLMPTGDQCRNER